LVVSICANDTAAAQIKIPVIKKTRLGPKLDLKGVSFLPVRNSKIRTRRAGG
jgi:hypothetical protein